MSMEDLLKAILGGASAQTPAQRPRSTSQTDPLAEILGGILGGAQQSGGSQQGQIGIDDILGGILGGGAQPSGRSQQGGIGIDDILGGILGGGAQPSGRSQQDQIGLDDILGGILGGGAQPSGRSQQDQIGLDDILGGILGGGAQQSGGSQQGQIGIDDILGGILGGGSGMNSNTFLGPIIQKLATQLGIPPAIAQMVVSFVLSKLLSGASAQSQATRPSQAVPRRQAQQQKQQGGQTVDLDDLLEQMSAGQTLDAGYLEKSGMTEELVQQTGMDSDTAAASLQEVFKALGGALGPSQQGRQTPQPKRKSSPSSGLDSLLDEM